MKSLLALALVAATLAGCKRGNADAPPCGAVGAKFFALARDALSKSRLAAQTDSTLRRAAMDQFPAMRDSIVAACTDGKWSAAVRKCLVDANDHLAFEACEQQLTDEQRTALDRAARGENAARSSD